MIELFLNPLHDSIPLREHLLPPLICLPLLKVFEHVHLDALIILVVIAEKDLIKAWLHARPSLRQDYLIQLFLLFVELTAKLVCDLVHFALDVRDRFVLGEVFKAGLG